MKERKYLYSATGPSSTIKRLILKGMESELIKLGALPPSGLIDNENFNTYAAILLTVFHDGSLSFRRVRYNFDGLADTNFNWDSAAEFLSVVKETAACEYVKMGVHVRIEHSGVTLNAQELLKAIEDEALAIHRKKYF